MAGPLVRRRFEIQGRVQGVGFRPFVYRLAQDLALAGQVGNDDHGVFVEIEGSAQVVNLFHERLARELPPLAHLASLRSVDMPLRGENAFTIAHSVATGTPSVEVTPDMATCDACLRELFDPGDRRHGYPFINCTDCGPRYSIIRAVPYDRHQTTMARFTMCPTCRAEYDDPLERRFHAQPNACPDCGPRVWLADERGCELERDPIPACAALLQEGKIVAIKGLGGFHLACRADLDQVVSRLRRRKRRETKPFALMVQSLDAARTIANVDGVAAELLEGPARPIVLLARKHSAKVSREVAPGSPDLGLMLPYTPLHAVLLEACGDWPLVMTSGNASGEPLCSDNQAACEQLAGLADAFLFHDRDIERPIDDSVLLPGAGAAADKIVAASETGAPTPAPKPGSATETTGTETPAFKPVILRRARGFVPDPILLDPPLAGSCAVLAVGGDLKATVCFAEGERAVLSEHLGDLENVAAYRNFMTAASRLKELLAIKPAIVACDLHPGYASTRYAQTLDLPVVPVQHHHAHIASCLVENEYSGPVIGVAADGTGYGTDGTIWGCEILRCDLASSAFTRMGCLDPFPLLGGDAAARDTWRSAAGLLSTTLGSEWPQIAAAHLRPVAGEALSLTAQRLAGSGTLPLTSSLGRLFDAVAFLLGLGEKNHHEAQAARALEAAAQTFEGAIEPLPFRLVANRGESDDDGRNEAAGTVPWRIDVGPAIRALLAEGAGLSDRRDRSIGSTETVGSVACAMARAFHATLVEALADCVERCAAPERIGTVALSGGCFANRLLLFGLAAKLEARGFHVLTHSRVPPGDGGIALGQAVIAAQKSAIE